MLSTVLSRSRTSIQGPKHYWWALAAVEVGNFLVYMDSFIVNLALPNLMQDFAVDVRTAKWVAVAYLLALTAVLMTAGRLSALRGRKSMTVLGMALMTLGSVLCALAADLNLLVVCRVVQGLGAALVLVNVMAEITAVFPKEQRGLAMGMNASVLALGQVTGLVVGGYIIESFGWRAVFWFCAALGLIGLLLDVAVLRHRAETPAKVGMDWLGTALSIVGLGGLFWALDRLGGGPGDPLGIGVLAASLIVVAAFFGWERRAGHPLLDPAILRSRVITCGSVASGLYFIVAVSCYFLMPLFAQIVMGLSPLMAGVSLLPLAIALTVSSQVTGHLTHRFSGRALSTLGMLSATAGVLLLSFGGAHPAYWLIALPLVLLGVGGGLFHPPNNSAVLSASAPESLSVTNGLLTTCRQLGQVIGAFLAAEILGQGLAAAGAGNVVAQASDAATLERYIPAYVAAQSSAYRLAVGFGLVGGLLAFIRDSRGASAAKA